ncbi:hypothetical protein C0971_18160 (plasmid) [Bacillus methanolicus]|nr:hypothetical protein C0971_18160 [Bacillus methanolicus]
MKLPHYLLFNSFLIYVCRKNTLSCTRQLFLILKLGFCFEVYPFPTEDSHFKESEGQSPMSKWEMNVGWR